MDKTKDMIRKFVSNMAPGNAVAISDETDLIEAGLLDSISMMSLINYLESAVTIEVKDSDFNIDNFNTINAIYELVNRSTIKKETAS